MESIIGKKYYPVDNSYSICLSDGGKNYMLGGNFLTPPKQKEECIIQSEPIHVPIKTYNGIEDKQMVLVTCPRGLLHMVLFDERGFANKEMQSETVMYAALENWNL